MLSFTVHLLLAHPVYIQYIYIYIYVCLTFPAQSSISKKLEQHVLIKTLNRIKYLKSTTTCLPKMAHQFESFCL